MRTEKKGDRRPSKSPLKETEVNIPQTNQVTSGKVEKSLPIITSHIINPGKTLSAPTVEDISTPDFSINNGCAIITNPVEGKYLPPSFLLHLISLTKDSPDKTLLVNKMLTGNGMTFGVAMLFIQGALEELGIHNLTLFLPNREVAIDKYKQFYNIIHENHLPVKIHHRIGSGGSFLPTQAYTDDKWASLTVAVMGGLDDDFFSGTDFILLDEFHKLDLDSVYRERDVAKTMHLLRESGVPVLQVTATPTRACDINIIMQNVQVANACRIEYDTCRINDKGVCSFNGYGVPHDVVDLLVEDQQADRVNRVLIVSVLTSKQASVAFKVFHERGLRVGMVVGDTVQIKMLNLFPPAESPLVLAEKDLDRADVIIATKAGCEGYCLHKEGSVLILNPSSTPTLCLTNQEICQLLGRPRNGLRYIAHPIHSGQNKLQPPAESVDLLSELGIYSKGKSAWDENGFGLSFKLVATQEARRIEQALRCGEIHDSLSYVGSGKKFKFLQRNIDINNILVTVNGNPLINLNPIFQGIARYETDPITYLRDLIPQTLPLPNNFVTQTHNEKEIQSFIDHDDFDSDKYYIQDVLELMSDTDDQLFEVRRDGVLSEGIESADILKRKYQKLFVRFFSDNGIHSTLINTYTRSKDWVNDTQKLPTGKNFKKGKGNKWFDYGKPATKKAPAIPPAPKLVTDKAVYPMLRAILTGLDVFLNANGMGDNNFATKALWGLENFDELHASTLHNLQNTNAFQDIIDRTKYKIADKKTALRQSNISPFRKQSLEDELEHLERRLALIKSPEWVVAPILASLLGLTKMHSKWKGSREFNTATMLGGRYLNRLKTAIPIPFTEVDLPQIAPNIFIAMAGISRDLKTAEDLYTTASNAIRSKNPNIPVAEARSMAKKEINTILNSLYSKALATSKSKQRTAGGIQNRHIRSKLNTLVALNVIPSSSVEPLLIMLRKIANPASFYYFYSFVEQRIIGKLRRSVTIPLGGFGGFRLHDAYYVADDFLISSNVDSETPIPQLDVIINTELGSGTLSNLVPDSVYVEGKTVESPMERDYIEVTLYTNVPLKTFIRSISDTVIILPEFEEEDELAETIKAFVDNPIRGQLDLFGEEPPVNDIHHPEPDEENLVDNPFSDMDFSF